MNRSELPIAGGRIDPMTAAPGAVFRSAEAGGLGEFIPSANPAATGSAGGAGATHRDPDNPCPDAQTAARRAYAFTMKRIALISTGGTIEKTYNEFEGVLFNQVSVLDVMLASLLLEGVEIVRVPLMNKDSVEMKESDHRLLAKTAATMAEAHEGVVIVHGTDNLAISGDCIVKEIEDPPVPIILTGAMRPYQLRNTDAMQNMTEALLAVQILPPGVYVAMHNKVLKFPGVVKDREGGMFVRKTDLT